MTRYVLRRLLLTVPVLIGASLLIYAMVYALPGDPVRALAGDRPLSPAVQAQIRADYNLDDPFLVQYGKYIWGLLHGDFGSDFSGRPVLETIGQRLPVTVRLTVVAVVFETLFGVTAGILASLRRNSFFDNLVLVSTTMLVSIPVFVLGFLAQYLFGFKLGWFPIAGIADGWVSYLLPGLVLASLSMAYVARLTRSAMLESLSADYIRTARAKGVGRTRIILRHAFRNSLIPVVTFIGADIGSLLGGAIVTESVFNLPGLGRAIFDAVRAQQGPVVVGIVTLMVFFYIFFNLVADVLYAVIDPRIRYD
ncbi:ABC transporter permease [Mycolicibacterium sp.]|uniref:ABC transporter permease n=1 Tax=Mycolicibacterium sp. TaxID=2320850 RepID=UPI001D50ED58|nr:ABC transporter permease [Mycolicibacterium sp.]MCB1291985.1 ABC transporter permease [Mycobacterium sp.]MCB9409453.1 ABC transporter permease [Mycolicibacterium sp.]